MTFTRLCVGINRIINRNLFASMETFFSDFLYSLRDGKRRKITAFKCTVADAYDWIGNDYACKASAFQKCTFADTCDRIWNCYTCKITATFKCAVAYTCNRIGYSYACKTVAFCKYSVTDTCDRIGNWYYAVLSFVCNKDPVFQHNKIIRIFRKPLCSFKRIFAYIGNRFGNGHVFKIFALVKC